MTPTSLRQHQVRRAHMRVLVRAIESAHEAMADADVLAAAAVFFGRRVDSERMLQQLMVDQDAEVQVLPWLLWDAPEPSGPLGQRLLSKTKSALERELLRGLLTAGVALWRVRRVEGAYADLERLDDRRTARVFEPLLEQGPPAGELLVARVVDLGDVQVLDAVHMALPAGCAPRLVRSARAAAVLPRHRQLRALLRAASRVAQTAVAAPRRPLHHDTLRATLVFRHEDEGSALQGLHQAAARGELEVAGPRRFAVTATGSGPLGAVLRVHGQRVHASTIRPAQMTSLRAAVEQWLPGAVWTMTVHRDLSALFDRDLQHPASAAEMRALASDWLSEVLAGFGETPLEPLGGITPREAARTQQGRQQLRLWLQAAANVAACADPRYQLQLQKIAMDLSAG
jgi:hypothetical protein